VFASKAGSDSNPDWYWNLRATPDVTIEVGDETIAVRATELSGAERDEKYRIQSERYPGFAGYQQKTSRTIPVIALTRRDAPAPDVHQCAAGCSSTITGRRTSKRAACKAWDLAAALGAASRRGATPTTTNRRSQDLHFYFPNGP